MWPMMKVPTVVVPVSGPWQQNLTSRQDVRFMFLYLKNTRSRPLVAISTSTAKAKNDRQVKNCVPQGLLLV